MESCFAFHALSIFWSFAFLASIITWLAKISNRISILAWFAALNADEVIVSNYFIISRSTVIAFLFARPKAFSTSIITSSTSPSSIPKGVCICAFFKTFSRMAELCIQKVSINASCAFACWRPRAIRTKLRAGSTDLIGCCCCGHVTELFGSAWSYAVSWDVSAPWLLCFISRTFNAFLWTTSKAFQTINKG